MDLKVNLLQDSLKSIRSATASLKNASTALNDNALCPQGKKMLVPHTTFLYVAGTLDDADNVLVDVGTGYFIEVSPPFHQFHDRSFFDLLLFSFFCLVIIFGILK